MLGFCCWIFVTACLVSQNCKQACHALDTANYEVSSPKNTASANQGAIIFYCCLIYPASFFLERKALGIQHAELPYMETLRIERKTLHFFGFELIENLCS